MTRPNALLEAVYESLGFNEAEGSFLDATLQPSNNLLTDWVDKGKWLSIAQIVGAEKVFFVNNNPVAVFARYHSNDPVDFTH